MKELLEKSSDQRLVLRQKAAFLRLAASVRAIQFEIIFLLG